MRRVLFAIIKIALFVIGFAIAVWVFMPWREVGSVAMTLASPIIKKQGMDINFTDVSNVDGGFTINGLSLASFMSVSCNSVTLRPQLAASILGLAPVCSVSFKNVEVAMGQGMNFGDGGFLLTANVLRAAGKREILLEQIHSNGDFAINGYLTIDPAQMKIGRADAALRIPDDFASNMTALQAFLPLERLGDNWFLRRNN